MKGWYWEHEKNRRTTSWMRQAAEAGDPHAQFLMGRYNNYDGLMFETDQEKSNVWYKRVAEQGYAPAQINLGVLYDHGRGVPADMETAVRCYRMSADQGYPHGQHTLGLCYKRGRGVDQDEAQASRLFNWPRSKVIHKSRKRWKKSDQRPTTNGSVGDRSEPFVLRTGPQCRLAATEVGRRSPRPLAVIVARLHG